MCIRDSLGVDLGQHRLQSRTPGTNTQRTDGIGLVDATQPVVQLHLLGCFQRGARLGHSQVEYTALAQTPYQLQVDRRPATGGLAIDRNDLLPRAQPRHVGQAAFLHRADDRAHLLLSLIHI